MDGRVGHHPVRNADMKLLLSPHRCAHARRSFRTVGAMPSPIRQRPRGFIDSGIEEYSVAPLRGRRNRQFTHDRGHRSHCSSTQTVRTYAVGQRRSRTAHAAGERMPLQAHRSAGSSSRGGTSATSSTRCSTTQPSPRPYEVAALDAMNKMRAVETFSD